MKSSPEQSVFLNFLSARRVSLLIVIVSESSSTLTTRVTSRLNGIAMTPSSAIAATCWSLSPNSNKDKQRLHFHLYVHLASGQRRCIMHIEPYDQEDACINLGGKRVILWGKFSRREKRVRH